MSCHFVGGQMVVCVQGESWWGGVIGHCEDPGKHQLARLVSVG
jgi:hypothetical protein